MAQSHRIDVGTPQAVDTHCTLYTFSECYSVRTGHIRRVFLNAVLLQKYIRSVVSAEMAMSIWSRYLGAAAFHSALAN